MRAREPGGAGTTSQNLGSDTRVQGSQALAGSLLAPPPSKFWPPLMGGLMPAPCWPEVSWWPIALDPGRKPLISGPALTSSPLNWDPPRVSDVDT